MRDQKQKYNSRLDESIGRREGAESNFRQSLKSRRDESKGEEKKETDHAYSANNQMDDRYNIHMAQAHHKYLANKYRKMMHTKKK
jgi:hypothetical protein